MESAPLIALNSTSWWGASQRPNQKVKHPVHALAVVRAESGAASKIGYTADPCRRLAGLQQANFDSLRFSHLFWIPEKVAIGVEKFALRLAKKMGKSLRGEWVDMTPEEAAFLVTTVVVESNAPCANSAMFVANHKMIVEAYRAQDCEWPSNIYHKTDWSKFKQRA